MDTEEVLLTRVMECLTQGLPPMAAEGGPQALPEAQWVRQYRQAARILIDHHLEGPHLAPARHAYDTGIVGGFYGLDALSTELMETGNGEPADELARVRKRMFRLGYVQGSAMRRASKAGAKPWPDAAV